MNFVNDFEVLQFDFNSKLLDNFHSLHYAKDLWPIVYILSDGVIKEAYVGETTDTYNRMSTHLKNNAKNKLTSVHLITSQKFNKSATLDIESNLIKYISGDGQYKLTNANLGLANHNYYQKKEVYWDIFKSIWNRLRSEGISKHSIEYIDNSDLFKYSPYKILTVEQRNGLLVIMENLLKEEYKNFIVEGGAGTGKTILAIFLFKLLNTNNEDFNFKEFGEDEAIFLKLINELKDKYPSPKMALVVPMSSFRKTLKNVFKNIKGLNQSMVIGPAEIIKENFDIVIVDESHRLRRRVNLGSYFGAFDVVCEKLNLNKNICNELDWVILQSKKAIFFYDESQSIKPSDVKKEYFDFLKRKTDTKINSLKSQFRVKGGNDYVEYINNILNCSMPKHNSIFNSKDYEFILFDSISDLIEQIKLREIESGLSRLIAGFSWPWISKNDKSQFDIKIENVELKWNTVKDDWINSDNAINEVGCIHTTQAYDLNYAGIIFGNEITFDKEKNEIVILKENYFDRNGSVGISEIKDLKKYILNIYKTVLLRGIKGTYVYVCDKNLREYFSKHIPNFKIVKTHSVKKQFDVVPYINSVPLFDLKAAAGNFSELQKVSDCEWVEIPSRFKPSNDLFACEVIGDSMNKVIPNGSICLFRKYTGGSREGQIVLVELTDIQDPDSGSSYTVKEYRSKKKFIDEQWSHQLIQLKPLSFDAKYSDIIIEEDELRQLKVLAIFECII